jgi:hypothetical protein
MSLSFAILPTRFKYILGIAVAVFVGGVVVTPSTASAGVYSDWGYYQGPEMSEGYFSNGGLADTNAAIRAKCVADPNARCPVLPNQNYAVDALDRNYYHNNGISSEQRARQLVADLRNKYNGQGEWGATGAAFIVNSMLGRGSDSPEKTRTIDDATWAEVERRLVDRANKVDAQGRPMLNWNIDIDNLGRYDTYTVNINGRWDIAYNNQQSVQNGLEIKNDDGSIAYRMWYSCANPIGDFVGIQAVSGWDISGKSYIKNSPNPDKAGSVEGTLPTPAKPGDQLNWYHDMRNIGPSDMNRDVFFNVDKTGFSNGWNEQKAPQGNARGANGSLFVYEYANDNRAYTRYTVTQADVGKTLCQRISWNPASSSISSGASSTFACANVPYNYTLNPSVTLNRTDAVEANTDVGVTGTVLNNGPTKSRETNWQVVRVIVGRGEQIPRFNESRINDGAPCGGYYAPRESEKCTIVKQSDGRSVYEVGSFPLWSGNDTVGDIPVGSQVCYGVSVEPYSGDSAAWSHSELECLPVSKKPTIHVVGGDVVAGRNTDSEGRIATSTSIKKYPAESRIFGSWGEYGLVAKGSIAGMASGAGYSKGYILTGDPAGATAVSILCSVSFLTVTNADSTGCTPNKLGFYDVTEGFQAVKDSFPVSSEASRNKSGSISLNGLSGTYTASGSELVITGSEIVKGQSVIINAPRVNVRIAGDIRYTEEGLVSTRDIPQVVIIANNITIEEGVERVDSWLNATGANGTLNTCMFTGTLNATKCAKQLTINGPVAAKHIRLNRTAGANPGEENGKPGELFNLRPDAYLWATSYETGASRLQTTSTIELPPRY